jgi:MFS family permease
MKSMLHWYNYITINVYWLGLTALSQTMTPLVIPLLIQQFVGEELKGTYYGNLRLWTLMTALLVQALMGTLSDRSTSRWGRRRPFIFVGTLGVIITVLLVGFTANLEGMVGYWVLFGFMVLMMIASNTAHSAQQGIIPDLVPEEKRGLVSGIKAVMEIPIPLILVAFTIAHFIKAGQLWAGLFTLIAILLVSMGITMVIPELPSSKRDEKFDWKPLLSLVLMTAVFTGVILGIGKVVNWLGQFSADLPVVWLMVVFGFLGLLGMAIAIGIGVYASIRIGFKTAFVEAPSFVWWVINRLAFMAGATNLASFAVYFLQGRLGYAQEKAAGPASTLTMFVGIFILFSAMPSGWLADRFGKKKLLVVAAISAAMGVVFAVSAPNLTMIYIGGCFIGAGCGLFYSANWALGTEIVPQEKAGGYLGISNLAGAGAGAIGAYIGGPIADFITRNVPQYPGLGYVLLFGIYGVLFLLSLLPLLRIKEKLVSEYRL